MNAEGAEAGPRELAAIRRFIFRMAEVDHAEDVDFVEATDRALERLSQLEQHIDTIEALARAEAARPISSNKDDN